MPGLAISQGYKRGCRRGKLGGAVFEPEAGGERHGDAAVGDHQHAGVESPEGWLALVASTTGPCSFPQTK